MRGGDRPGVVLVGVDDTPYARLAADWAAAEAERRGCPLRLVHAVGSGTGKAHGETGAGSAGGPAGRVLDAAVALLDDTRALLATTRGAVPVDTRPVPDDAATALLAAARDADMVVVGSRGRGGFAGLRLGSVSRKVAAHADRPVVVVRGDAGKPVHRGIVAGVRDERDEEAVRFALEEAELHGAGVRLLHAWTPLGGTDLMVPRISHIEEERDAHAQLLDHAARAVAEHPAVHLDTELTRDAPAAALVDATARAGLVVLPRHPVEGRLGLPLGTVVHAVLQHASCPVAVVPVG